MQRQRIKSFVMPNGERYRLLVDRESGVPLNYPNLYVTTQVRNRSRSVAAMESALAGVSVLLTFCDERGIDLEGRVWSRDYMTLQEMEAFQEFCQQKRTSTRTKSALTAISRNRRAVVDSSTEYMRLTHSAKYVKWLAQTMLAKTLCAETNSAINALHDGLLARRPQKKGRNQEADGKSLDAEQLNILIEKTRLGAKDNPYQDEGIQKRNELLVDMLVYFGIRSGELLNIKIKDINFSKNQLLIARRPDEKSDPRTHQPHVKTLDRLLPVKDTLIATMHEYITRYRNKVPNARKNQYLFITHKSGPTQGQPISSPAYQKIIKKIATTDESLKGLHAHKLRHTWNSRFSWEMDGRENPPSHESQEKMRSYLQGWKEGSGTASHYNHRFVKEKAMEVATLLQKKAEPR